MAATTSAQQSAASTPLPQVNQGGLSTSSDLQAEFALPPASTFDILPLLHELLRRLLASENAINPPGALTPLPTAAVRMYPNESPVAVQQLANEASKIRNRIRKARTAVDALPDMDRDLQEQEEELLELRDQIMKQRAVISGLTIMS